MRHGSEEQGLTMPASDLEEAGVREDAGRPLVRVEDLVVTFQNAARRQVQAVSGLSFEVRKGETLGLVGESGCGKSTVAKAVMRLVEPTSGRVIFDGEEIQQLRRRKLRLLRPHFQMISQNPLSAVNPLRRVRSIVEEPLRLWRRESKSDWPEAVEEALQAVGLDPDVVGDRLPRELSGGQLQRVCIARALVLHPKLLVADEPIASLDVSIQAQILNLLLDSRERFDLAMILIAHDLAAVRAVSDRVAVMYLGKLCEIGTVREIYSAPMHPYTAALLNSVPRLTARNGAVAVPLAGEVPSPIDPPSGCRFRTRCPIAKDRCAVEEPKLTAVNDNHAVACHFTRRGGGDV